MKKILIFAGTTEGRILSEELSRMFEVHACVATEYGKDILLQQKGNIIVHKGRLDVEEMVSLMTSQDFEMVIDTTHPYADIVTKNIKKAAEISGTSYQRLLRDSAGSKIYGKNVVFVENTLEAISYLNEHDGNVLLTIGSKELSKYNSVLDFENRLYARVLPMESVVKSCNEAGFHGRQLICMQGPFTEDFNLALIEQIDAKILVTKDSGKVGGLEEKIRAANSAGIQLLVVGRPTREDGRFLNEILEYFKKFYGLEVSAENIEIENNRQEIIEKKDWFPLFENIKGKEFVVIGGGKIACRRVFTMLNFSCNLTIISPELADELEDRMEEFTFIQKEYEVDDIDKADFVLIATNNSELNSRISKDCRDKGIASNNCSNKEECDFYFPGILVGKDITIGITAQGKNHKLAKDTKKKIERALRS